MMILLPLVRLDAVSVTILFDASYSLSLRSGGRARIEELREALDLWMSGQPLSTRYALLVAEHRAEVAQRLPYPATSRQVSLSLREVVPWGAVDLVRAIEQAARTASSIAVANEEPHARLLLLTDGEDFAALLPPRPVQIPPNVVFESITLASTSPASVLPLLDALAAHPGSLPSDPPAVSDPVPRPTPTPRLTQADRVEPTLIGRWAGIARWVFVATLLFGLLAVAKAAASHRRRLRIVERHNARPPVLGLELRGPAGRSGVRIGSYPHLLTVAADMAALEFRVQDDTIRISCPVAIRVNGIARTDHSLETGDQIRAGAVRLFVREIERTRPVRAPRARHRRYALAPAAAAAVAVLAFILAEPRESAAAVSAPETAVLAPATTRQPESAGRAQPDRPLVHTTTSAPALPMLTLPAVVGPADPLPPARLDYLAFHAHPDDEALDFGGLLARLHASGLSGAVVIMTDGESGLDQHPWREVDDTYPAYRLAGADLARVRIAEAREAIGWLGGSYYLRLGLPNHPYNTWLDVMTPQEVIEAWGGERVVERIDELIRHFRPRFVISPDGPGPGREHFEHEATGIIVARALERIDGSAASPVQAHIVPIDPLQPDGYDDLIRVSPWTPAADGSIPRLRQLLALRAHRTQRDATVIGVETRLALPYDYVLLRSGEPQIVRRLFGAAILQRAHETADEVDPVPRADLTEHR